MADSENSRTLPSNTHLNILSCTTDFLARDDSHTETSRGADPAVERWTAWYEAHREFGLLCRLQQHLEVQLTEAVGFPVIDVEVPGKSNPITVHSEADIEYWLKGSRMAAARDKTKEALAAQIGRWNTADRVTGYSRAREAANVASDRERALASELWDLPASSVEGVIAKLHVVLTLGIASPECDEFPWPPLRAALSDLLVMTKIDTSTFPAVSLPGPRC